MVLLKTAGVSKSDVKRHAMQFNPHKPTVVKYSSQGAGKGAVTAATAGGKPQGNKSGANLKPGPAGGTPAGQQGSKQQQQNTNNSKQTKQPQPQLQL